MSSPSSKEPSVTETKSESTREIDPSPSKSSDTIKSIDGSKSNGKNVSEYTWSTDKESFSTDTELLELGSGGTLESRLMKIGSEALLRLDFDIAAIQFKRALDILIKKHGKLAPECVEAYFNHGLALMYESHNPRSKDVMVSLWVKETGLDTYKPSPIHSDSSDDDNEYFEKLQDNFESMDSAWSIIDKEPGDTRFKVEILTALGEFAYRRAKPCSENFYREALSMLERLPGKNYLHRADLSFKLCLCTAELAKDRKEVALNYLKKANSVLEIANKELLSEYKSAESVGKTVGSGSNQEPSNVDPIDPSVQQKANELTMLGELANKFLEHIRFFLDLSQIKDWPFANQVPKGRPNQPKLESPTASTGNTSEICSSVGEKRGVKRKLSTDSTSTDSNPNK